MGASLVHDRVEGPLDDRCANRSCGEIILGSPSFCPHCGTRQDWASCTTPTAGAPEEPDVKGPAFVAVGVSTVSPVVANHGADALMVQIRRSQVAWIAASAVALIAGFFVVPARPIPASAPPAFTVQVPPTVLAPPPLAVNPTLRATNPSTQAVQMDGAAATAATAVVTNYWSAWSSSNDDTGEAVRPFYAQFVTYYGKTVPTELLMKDKAQFARRWPVRSYIPLADKIATTCNADSACTVIGVVNWQCANNLLPRRSVGSASFTFTVANGQIIAESGSVLSRNLTS